MNSKGKRPSVHHVLQQKAQKARRTGGKVAVPAEGLEGTERRRDEPDSLALEEAKGLPLHRLQDRWEDEAFC